VSLIVGGGRWRWRTYFTVSPSSSPDAPSRPAAGSGDFGLLDAAGCQARAPGQDLFLHPFLSQPFQSEV
jgi:hypothetical protein